MGESVFYSRYSCVNARFLKFKNLVAFVWVVKLFGDLDGAPGGIRTPDGLIRSQPLYPAEVRAHIL